MPKRLPNRWSLAHNPLTGLTFGKWCRLLWDNRFAVELAYAHRAAFLTGMSLFNSVWHAAERLRYGRAIRNVQVRSDPIFILGHWRSGTTHLHNLLALDNRLAFPTTFQVVNPFSFLVTQRRLPAMMGPLLPKRRPMDNMSLSFEAPQEDELGLSLLTLKSPYLSLSFPRRASHYARYLTFANVPQQEIDHWKQAFLQFVRKLSLRQRRCFVFKSPGHTARIALLLEMFPQARFVHIHRDPYTVFASSRHYLNTSAWHANLQAHDPDASDTIILRQYSEMYDAYLHQRQFIPAGRLCEMAYESLVADPLNELRRVYDELELEPFHQVETRVTEYLESIADYRCNGHPELEESLCRRIASEWKVFFEAFGYATDVRRTPPAETRDTVLA